MDAAKLRRHRISHSNGRERIQRPARQPELARQNANDCVRVPAEADTLPKNRRICTESARPKTVSEHHQARAAVSVFFGGKKAAERRLKAERAEELGVAKPGGNLNRLSLPREVERLHHHAAD